MANLLIKFFDSSLDDNLNQLDLKVTDQVDATETVKLYNQLFGFSIPGTIFEAIYFPTSDIEDRLNFDHDRGVFLPA